MTLIINHENIPKFKELEFYLLNYNDTHLHEEIYQKALKISKSITQIEAIFILGSIANDTADFFSDIDFYVMCKDKEEVKLIREQLVPKIDQIAPIIHTYRSNARPNDLIVFFNPFIKFELVIETSDALSKKWKLGTSSKLIFDRSGFGENVLREAQKIKFNIKNHMNEITNLAIELPSFCYIICGYLIRGEFVTSIDFISWIRRKMLRISGFLLGVWDEGTRRAEQRFPVELIEYYNDLKIGKNEEIWEKLNVILDWYSNWMVPKFEEHKIMHANVEVPLVRNIIKILKLKKLKHK